MTYRDRETGKLFSSWARVRAARGSMSLPAQPTPQIEEAAGVDRVAMPPKPAVTNGKKAIKSSPRQQPDGTWAHEWSVAALSGDELAESIANRKATMRAAVGAELNRQYAQGFAYDFGVNTAANEARLPDGTTEPAGVRTLQLRTAFDRSQWSAVAQAAQSYIAQGQPNEPMRPLRTLDDARVTVTAGEAFAAMMALQTWAGATLEHSWDLKDAIESASTHADLDVIDIQANWP